MQFSGSLLYLMLKLWNLTKKDQAIILIVRKNHNCLDCLLLMRKSDGALWDISNDQVSPDVPCWSPHCMLKHTAQSSVLMRASTDLSPTSDVLLRAQMDVLSPGSLMSLTNPLSGKI